MKTLAKIARLSAAVLIGYLAVRIIRALRDDVNIYERMWR